MKTGFLELFEPLRVLGRGGMGAVWEVRHRATGTVLAVKFARERAASSARDRLAFEREVRAQARVHHPAVLPVLAFGELAHHLTLGEHEQRAGSRWCAFERLAGGSLADVDLRWSDLRVVLLRLLDALAHCHARDLVHLDLKPENLLWREHPTDVILADFGIAQLMGQQDRLVGTPPYMSPEQWRRQPLDGRADLYSLGCVAYRLFVGVPPFLGHPRALMQAHLEKDLPSCGDPTLDAWIARATTKDPADRFQTAATAAAALPVTLETVARTGTTVSATLSLTALLEIQGDDAPLPQVRSGTRALPTDWRTRKGRLHRAGTLGLGALGLRELPLLGREPLQDALWAAARRVASGEGAELVVLTGAPGAGRSRLLRWLGARLRELDAAVVLDRPHPYGPDLPFAVHLVDDAEPAALRGLLTHIERWTACGARVLVVVTTDDPLELPTLEVPALEGAQALALAMGWASLSPPAAAALVEASGALPGVMAWMLESAMRSGHLVEGPDGLVLTAPPPPYATVLSAAERDLVATVQALPVASAHRVVELQDGTPLPVLQGLLRRGLIREEGDVLSASARCPQVELPTVLRRRAADTAPSPFERALHASHLDATDLVTVLGDRELRMAGPLRDAVVARAEVLVPAGAPGWTDLQMQRALQARDTGDVSQAVDAVAALREVGDAHALGLALTSVAELHARGQRLDEAWALVQEAQALLATTGSHRERILAQTAAALVAMNRFDWGAADQALTIGETLPGAPPEDQVRLVPWRRALLASTGQLDEALRLSLQELERHPTYHGLRNTLPLLWWELRRPEEAIAFAETCGEAPPLIRRIVDTMTALCHLAVGDWEAADRTTLRPDPGFSESARRHVRLVCAAAEESRPFDLLVTSLRPPARPRFDDVWETWLLRTAAWRAEQAGLPARATVAAALAATRAAALPEDLRVRIPEAGPFRAVSALRR